MVGSFLFLVTVSSCENDLDEINRLFSKDEIEVEIAKEANYSGMPTDPQAEEMRGFEDVIQSCVDEDRLGILAFVRTGDGTRAWYFYVSDIAEVGNRINAALEPGLPVQLTVQDDPEWNELRNVYVACGEQVSG